MMGIFNLLKGTNKQNLYTMNPDPKGYIFVIQNSQRNVYNYKAYEHGSSRLTLLFSGLCMKVV